MKKTIKVPEYFKDLPDDAYIDSTEAARVIGYKNRIGLLVASKRGVVPKPDDSRFLARCKGKPCLYWKVKTIREWIENVNRNIPK